MRENEGLRRETVEREVKSKGVRVLDAAEWHDTRKDMYV
jgi:hypothetical protein